MSEKHPIYICDAPAIPCADLAYMADILSHVSDLLDCVDHRAMPQESAIYLQESRVLIDLSLTQLNRWTGKEEGL